MAMAGGRLRSWAWANRARVAVLLALLVGWPGRAAAQQGGAGSVSLAELSQVAEEVYMVRSGGHNAMFVVTDEGVIATDPLGQNVPRFPELYRAAIASVTDQPVRYVVYSFNHADHITGGAVFADTAQFVAHRLAAPKIAARNDPRTPVPTVLVDDFLALELGGKVVELHYAGRNNSDNSLVVHYPARRIAFTPDFVRVRSVLFRNLSDIYPEQLVASLRWVEERLDFDVLVPSHGPVTTRDAVRESREYAEDLMAAVRAAQQQGLAPNSPEMVAAVRAALAPRYATWGNFDAYLPLNVEGLLRIWASE
jgi:glyoxylase-like metal-dependent hydrolase (beta-lactamase superfamily II)